MGVAKRERVPSASWRPSLGPAVWLLFGVGAAALSTYVYLIAVAREVSPEEYASFSSFWALMIIISTGIYIPIEQETGRRGVDAQEPGVRRSLLPAAMGAALVVTAVLALLLLVSWPATSGFFGGDALLAVALALGALAYAVQCPIKGVLSAERRYRWYAAVLSTESLLRIIFVLVAVAVTERQTGLLAMLVGLGALGSALVGLVGARSGPTGRSLPLLRSASVLISGAVALQSLLYSAIVVARALAPPGEEAAAGRLLAAISVARIPVFVFQSFETLVVPRVAELAVIGDQPRLRAAVRRLVLVVGGLALATTVVAALLGPPFVSLMFGEEYAVTHGVMALLGLGTGVFMLAVVASDVTVSLGGHAEMARSWVISLVVGGLSVALLPTFVLQVTLPLVAGSLVAMVLLGRAASGRIRDLAAVRV